MCSQIMVTILPTLAHVCVCVCACVFSSIDFEIEPDERTIGRLLFLILS